MMTFWTRPLDKVPYPNIWLEFTAKESKNSEKVIKYWIQDLPEDRLNDALQHIEDYFLAYAPIPTFFGVPKNKGYIRDYINACRLKIANRTTLACFREGSDEIVGLNVLYVAEKQDTFWKEFIAQAENDEYKEYQNICKICSGGIDIYEKYNIDKYLASICLQVSSTYRGLSIAQRLLEAREPLCKALGIPVTQSFFTSDYSNYIADKVGFEVDSQYTVQELNEIYPKFPFHQMGANAFTYKSMDFRKKTEEK